MKSVISGTLLRFYVFCIILSECWSEKFITQRNLNEISLEIIKANVGRNLVFAPFAFRFPLCKLAAVATGTTKQELSSMLEFKKAEEAKTCFASVYRDIGRLQETDMTLLNMMYVNYTDDIDSQFISDVSDFGVTVSRIGFHYPKAAVAFVNNEFESKTYKRIKDVLEAKDIDNDSSILILNGIHFRTSWENSFKVKHTKKKIFYGLGSDTSEVFLMNGIQQCLYFDDESERYKAISLKLANFGVSVLILLPDKDISIDNFLSSLLQTPDAVQKIRKKMKWDNVNVFLPRFKIKTCLDWTEYLRQFGLNMTTNKENKDLKAILVKKAKSKMYLSKAKQKVFFDTDEMGTHRQNLRDTFDLRNQEESRELPDTAFETLAEFKADRPFLFFISMITERAVEFEIINGVYYGPEKD